jgi:hypothetical protein
LRYHDGVRQLAVSAFFAASTTLLLLPSACSEDSETPSGPISFEKNVMPILANNCALAACHGSKESNLGIFITADKKQVFDELQKSSPSFGKGALKFVVAGSSSKSFVMRKMDGDHNKLTECSNGCGKEMPPDTILSAGKRETVRRWIDQGAKDN